MSTLALREERPVEPGEAALWTGALALVVGLHVAIALYLLAHVSLAPPAAQDLPAIMVDMAPPATSPREAPGPPRPQVAQSAAPDPVVAPVPDVPVPDIPPPDPVRREIAPVPEAPPPATPASAEIAPPQPVPDLPVPPIPPPAVVPPNPAVVLPPPPKSAAKPEPASKPAPPKPIAKAPPPKPKPEAKPRRPAPTQAQVQGERRIERRAPSEAAGARTAAQPSVSAGASAASAASWQARLVAYLQSQLRYPSGLGGGSASLSFTVLRSGRVASAQLSRSSGNATLDAAALAVLRGAVPPPPPDVPGASFNFNIPVRFTQR